MDKLIYLTGEIDSPFFLNEIDYFKKQYDEVIAIAYDGDRAVCDELSSQHGFQYHFISDVKNDTKLVKRFIKWRQNKYVKEEIAKNRKHGLQFFPRTLYVLYYGLYNTKLHMLTDSIINESDNYYIYSFWLSRPGFGTASFSMDRRSNIVRLASRTHRYDLYEEENEIGYLPFRKFICESLDTIYFSSEDTIQYYKNKNYSSKQPSYKLAYLGTRPYERKKIDTKKKKLVIASCSYIIDRKRLDLIIQFIKQLQLLDIDVKWIHIGDGEKEKAIAEMAERELNKGSFVFTGRMKDDDIYEMYRREDVDFFINLSDSEGIPVSIMEALSMGIPIIARNVGGISDAVKDGINGILIENENDMDLAIRNAAKIVKTSYFDKEVYTQLSEAAYERWQRLFNRDRNAGLVAMDIKTNSFIDEICF